MTAEAIIHELTLLNMGYSLHNGDWNFGPICSNISRIYWVCEGEAEVSFLKNRHTLTPGHLYLIPSLQTHSDHNKGRFGHYYIHFIDPSNSLIRLYQKYRLPFEVSATEKDSQLIHHLYHMSQGMKLDNPQPSTYETSTNLLERTLDFRRRSLGDRMEISGMILQLLSRFFHHAEERHTISDNRIINSLYRIENHKKGMPSIAELASEAYLCKDSFIRLFKHQTGLTPKEHIIQQRILHAQMLFIHGHRSVKEVAYEIGYTNISFFGRQFKKITGVSPLEFIRQNR